MVACIGWGSLLWDPQNLMVDGEWKGDGPLLPIEFARCSDNGRVTLVMVPSADQLVQTSWCRLNYSTLDEASEQLRIREGRTRRSWIGRWPRATTTPTAISDWAAGKNLEGVVWTDIPPRWNGTVGAVPTADEVVAYLDGLEGDTRGLAEQYIREAPEFVRTPYRTIIEERLGWRRMEP